MLSTLAIMPLGDKAGPASVIQVAKTISAAPLRRSYSVRPARLITTLPIFWPVST